MQAGAVAMHGALWVNRKTFWGGELLLFDIIIIINIIIIAIACVALKNPEVVAKRGGLSTILKSVIDCQLSRINEALITTILHLLNHPRTRQYVRVDVELEVCVHTHTHTDTHSLWIEKKLLFKNEPLCWEPFQSGLAEL